MQYALALCLLLAGCGCGYDNSACSDNHGYGFGYDAATPSGLRLRYAAGVTRSYLETPDQLVEWFDKAYSSTENCTQLFGSPPLVVVVPQGTLGQNIGGLAYLDTKTIAVDEWTGQGGLLWNLRHEYIHVLLAESGYPEDKNSSHDSPLFNECGPISTL